MGADVMRWQYCMQPPNQNLLFGFSPGQEIQRKLLTFWNSAAFFIQYADVAGFRPSLGHLEGAPPPEHLLDRWLQARTAQLITETTEAYERYLTVDVLRAFESFTSDLSNWYIRRSRRRFWNGDSGALRSLWASLVQSLRVISPVMPFLAEHLWQRLVVPVSLDAPRSVFLAGWPASTPADEQLLGDFDAAWKVVELGRRARVQARLKLRQPLRLLLVEGAERIESYLGEIADELRVKEVRIGRIETTRLRVRPNLPVVGRRLGKDVPRVRAALDAGAYIMREDGAVEVAGHVLGPEEVLIERLEKEGWAVAADEGVTVAFDTALDDALRQEARVYDLIHQVNTMRRNAGLDITDRILLTLPEADRDLLKHHDWIAAETLATSITTDGTLSLIKAT
jgi:isoleucyl-tRNA synthetase